MKKRKSAMSEKIAIVLAAAAVIFGSQLCPAAPKDPKGSSTIQQQIQGTLKSRIDLLTKLVSDYEKQYKKGSLGGMSVLKAKVLLYKAELLKMKADAGLLPEPGIAVALIDFYAVTAYVTDLQKRFTRGNMSLSILLNAQIQANDAEIKYLTLLKRCRQPGAVEAVRKKLPPFDPAKRLDHKLLQELFAAELKAK